VQVCLAGSRLKTDHLIRALVTVVRTTIFG
jgi:hypothetical protein